MIKELSNLNESEAELMLKAPVWVAILMAGADDKIEKKEISAAKKFAHNHFHSKDNTLNEFYRQLSKRFDVEIDGYLSLMPKDVTRRNEIIIGELKKLNDIWSKLDPKFALRYYESLLILAEKVASSSGGILGMLNIGPEEQKLIGLKMIKKPEGSK